MPGTARHQACASCSRCLRGPRRLPAEPRPVPLRQQKSEIACQSAFELTYNCSHYNAILVGDLDHWLHLGHLCLQVPFPCNDPECFIVCLNVLYTSIVFRLVRHPLGLSGTFRGHFSVTDRAPDAASDRGKTSKTVDSIVDYSPFFSFLTAPRPDASSEIQPMATSRRTITTLRELAAERVPLWQTARRQGESSFDSAPRRSPLCYSSFAPT